MPKEQKYETTGIMIYKTKNRKSVTIPITEEQFGIEKTNGKLVLNVSHAGLLKFLLDENWIRFNLNKIEV